MKRSYTNGLPTFLSPKCMPKFEAFPPIFTFGEMCSIFGDSFGMMN